MGVMQSENNPMKAEGNSNSNPHEDEEDVENNRNSVRSTISNRFVSIGNADWIEGTSNLKVSPLVEALMPQLNESN